MIETDIGDKISTLRTDRGGDYTSREFEKFSSR